MKYLLGLTMMLIFWVAAKAQSDSILAYNVFMQQLQAYHPMSQKADLLVTSAKAGVLEAKGGFDPVLGFKKSNKNFNGTSYYDKDMASIAVPLPFGSDVVMGAERAAGSYLNPEVTPGTISYIGIDLPILKGLWIDERRAALQKARLNLDQSEQARLLAFNELAANAALAYWSWKEAYHLYRLTENTLQLAQQRMNLLRTLQANGDRSEGDTIEVFVQVNQLLLQRDEQYTRYLNATINLTAFVWDEALYDALVNKVYLPPTNQWGLADETTILGWLMENSNIETLPALRWYDSKLAMLQVDKRYKQQALLPELKLSTRLQSNNIYTFTGLDRFYFTENYNLGIQFKMPLLFREGRGGWQQAQIKILDTGLDRDVKRREISNKRTALLNEYNLLSNQLMNVSALINAQQRLYKLELSKFTLGESSVFLVNSREQKLLELKAKEIELNAKKAKVLAKSNELKAGF
jgi:outer membrane protein TolC